MDYIALSDHAARQTIDSGTVFGEFVRVKHQAQQYAGGMYWKRHLRHRAHGTDAHRCAASVH